MRCLSCDKNLNDYEATRKYSSGGFIDLCNHCFSFIKDDLEPVRDRPDLMEANEEYEEFNEDES